MKLKVELEGRDLIEVEYEGETAPGVLAVKSVSMIGCTDFMNMMHSMKRSFGADVSKWPLPNGTDHGSLLLAEMILKLRGEWNFPYMDEELCHCRSIATQTVDQAIIAGAHSPEVVTRQTSASTACGTCRPTVQKIIDYRTGRKTA
jgi:bacterioferritin-associated ferredoxin